MPFTRTMGGPGTKDPGRAVWENAPLSGLVAQAYDLQRFQLKTPGWMDAARYNITAKVPEGATKEQFRVMLQNLLATRFALVFHREKKEMPVYELVVGKSGHKLKESSSDPGAERWTRMGMKDGLAQINAQDETMEMFVTRLSGFLAAPVTDGTGLKGKYDFDMSWAFDMTPLIAAGIGPPPPPPGPDGAMPAPRAPDPAVGPTLFSALQEQLGLKLESKKGFVEILVVDRAERVPTEN